MVSSVSSMVSSVSSRDRVAYLWGSDTVTCVSSAIVSGDTVRSALRSGAVAVGLIPGIRGVSALRPEPPMPTGARRDGRARGNGDAPRSALRRTSMNHAGFAAASDHQASDHPRIAGCRARKHAYSREGGAR